MRLRVPDANIVSLTAGGMYVVYLIIYWLSSKLAIGLFMPLTRTVKSTYGVGNRIP